MSKQSHLPVVFFLERVNLIFLEEKNLAKNYSLLSAPFPLPSHLYPLLHSLLFTLPSHPISHSLQSNLYPLISILYRLLSALYFLPHIFCFTLLSTSLTRSLSVPAPLGCAAHLVHLRLRVDQVALALGEGPQQRGAVAAESPREVLGEHPAAARLRGGRAA